jgi:hypothetical protein
MPPFGPRSYSFITSLYRTVSRISMFAPNGIVITAGSRLTIDIYSYIKIYFLLDVFSYRVWINILNLDCIPYAVGWWVFAPNWMVSK